MTNGTTAPATNRHVDPDAPALQSTMARNATGLMIGKSAQLGLGFLFWVIGAQLFDEAAIGIAAGAVAATMLSVQFAIIGVDAAYIVLYPHTKQRGALLRTAMRTLAATGVVVAAAMLLFAYQTNGDYRRIVSRPELAIAFAAAAVLATQVVLFERVSVARKRGDEVFVRNAANGLISLLPFALIWALDLDAGATTLFTVWFGGVLVAFLLGLYHNARSPHRDPITDPADPRLARKLLRVGLPNHVLSSAERLPMLILPIIVLDVLGATSSAHWYTTWQMAFAVYSIPIAVGTALFAEGAADPQHLARDARKAVSLTLSIAIPLAMIAGFIAPFALRIVGSGYADAGTKPLRILLLGVVPFVFVQTYYALCRSLGRLTEATALAMLIASMTIAATLIVAPDHGLSAVAVSWVMVLGLGALWALPRGLQLSRMHHSPTNAMAS